MSFIPFVPDPKELLKSGIEKAKKRASQTSGFNKRSMKKKREMVRVESLSSYLYDKLHGIVTSTASFDKISPFYRDLIASRLDLVELKRALAVLNWIAGKTKELDRYYRRRMRRETDISEIVKLRKQFEARVEDILMKNSNAFFTLKDASKKLEDIPKVKDIPTVILAGYPNVGKSSILRGLTGSEVEIREYPFTTKKILIGYVKDRYRSIQVIDTPGLLDRPIEKANPIERQALAALRHLSKKVLFVVDPSETCGYSIDDQMKLLDSIRKRDLDVRVVANKSDIYSGDFSHRVDLVISAMNSDDIEKLKKFLFEWLYS